MTTNNGYQQRTTLVWTVCPQCHQLHTLHERCACRGRRVPQRRWRLAGVLVAGAVALGAWGGVLVLLWVHGWL